MKAKLVIDKFSDGNSPQPRLDWIEQSHCEIIKAYNRVTHGIMNYHVLAENNGALIEYLNEVMTESCWKLLSRKFGETPDAVFANVAMI